MPDATQGADAAFASGTAHRAGPEGEAGHGANLAEAIAASEVSHLVFVSGDGGGPDSPLPLFQGKVGGRGTDPLTGHPSHDSRPYIPDGEPLQPVECPCAPSEGPPQPDPSRPAVAAGGCRRPPCPGSA